MKRKIFAILCIALVFASSIGAAAADNDKENKNTEKFTTNIKGPDGKDVQLLVQIDRNRKDQTATVTWKTVRGKLPDDYSMSLELKGDCPTCDWYNFERTSFFHDFPLEVPIGPYKVFIRISASTSPADGNDVLSKNVVKINFGKDQPNTINPYSIQGFGVYSGKVSYWWNDENNLPEGIIIGQEIKFWVNIEDLTYSGIGTVEKVHRNDGVDIRVVVEYPYSMYYTNIVTKSGNYPLIEIL